MLRHALFAFSLLVVTAVACGNSGNRSGSSGGPGTDGGAGDTGSLFGDDGSAAQGTLVISPLAPVLTAVTGKAPPTQQFKATLNGQPTNAAWSFDRGELGLVDASGLFTASGTYGGVGHI
ncbi:MAG TPA: hypothetical protein VIF09_10905, partial [Polyangiaceae bacterium]